MKFVADEFVKMFNNVFGEYLVLEASVRSHNDHTEIIDLTFTAIGDDFKVLECKSQLNFTDRDREEIDE